MKTRQKILSTALGRFNKQGIQEVSLRDIAKDVNISVGNLNYHFPTTNDIIYSLYLQLIEDLNEAIGAMMEAPDPNPLVSMYNMMHTAFTTHLKYRFLFEGRYAEIVTNIPKMKDYTQETFANHFTQGTQMVEHMVKEGLLQKQILTDINGFLYMQNMLGLYWQQELAIFHPQLSNEMKVQQALAVSFQPYIPYLTEKGKATLAPLLKELKPYQKQGESNK